MQIGIIGTGSVAKTLAGALVGKHDVFLASREPAGKAGLPAPVKGYGALAGADLVISAVPGALALGALREIGTDGWGNKILVDVGNAVTDKFALAYPEGSLAATLQQAFPGLRVVKAFNTFNTSVMGDPRKLSAPSDAFVSGNDAAAKSAVIDLHVDIGWHRDRVHDLGGIEMARAQEHYFYLFVALVRSIGNPKFNIAVVR